MDHARMANMARAKDTFCFESELLPFKLFAPIKRWLKVFQKTWNPPQWLKSSVCSWFSLGGTGLSRGGVSECKLLERVLRWLWRWLFSYRVAPNGVERNPISCSRPMDGINPSILQSVEGWTPTLPPKQVPGEVDEGLWALWLMDQTSQSS